MTNATLMAAKSEQTDLTFTNGVPYEREVETGPHPQYYLLLPLTVPADIVTLPFQLFFFTFAPKD
jgi:hypothetical protein